MTECKEFEEAYGYPTVVGVDTYTIQTEDVPDWPKGCYDIDGNGVVFNQHDIGSANIYAAQICKDGGKGMRSFLTSMHLLL